MLQARMATRAAKPDGQFWLRPEDVANFMLDKEVTDLPGSVVFFNSSVPSALCLCSYQLPVT